MQVIKIILVLITVGCIVGPIGTVVIMYRNNLSQMVITPQIQQLTNSGNNNSNNNGNNNNNNNNNGYNNNINPLALMIRTIIMGIILEITVT